MDATTPTASAQTFLTWLAARGHIAHTRDARRAGYSTRAIADAVAASEVLRVRRSWLVGPACDPRQRRAAEVGGRLTCVSEAERMGLWVPPHSHVHIAVPPTASRIDAREEVVLHWGGAIVPAARTAVSDPVLNVLGHVARCLPREHAMAVWESALRTGAVSLPMLQRVQWRGAAAKELVAEVSVLSDSGIETIFVSRIAALSIPIRQQVRIDDHRVDALIGERLVVQIDGFRHHADARTRRADIRDDARLTLMGYTVIRFDWKQVMLQWDEVEATVQTAIAQGLHRSPTGARGGVRHRR